jgi:hypothetical protein
MRERRKEDVYKVITKSGVYLTQYKGADNFSVIKTIKGFDEFFLTLFRRNEVQDETRINSRYQYVMYNVSDRYPEYCI